eukprot:415778_1
MSTDNNRTKPKNAHPSASSLIARFNETLSQQSQSPFGSNPNSRKSSHNTKLSTDKSDIDDIDIEYSNDIQGNKKVKKPRNKSHRKVPPPPKKPKSINKENKPREPSLLRQQQSNPKLLQSIEEKEKESEHSTLNNEQTSLEDLNNMILLYQQAVDDVHQAIVDVKETSKDITNKVKSVTEQLHIIIDTREDELLDEITKKTASNIFALDTQFTKLQQRLMFCREARNEAKELLNKHNEYNINCIQNIQNIKTRTRNHSSGSVINYNARKDRIMAIVNKTKQDAKNEFEKELNRGEPIVNTRFHVQHYDITKEFETLGNIIDDIPLAEYILYPPLIIKTRVFKKSLRVHIKSREKIENSWQDLCQILECQFEPQLVFINQQKELNNPEQLLWKSLGWIELNPIPIKSEQGNSQMQKGLILNEYSKLITGLTDFIDNDNNGKYIYIRTRIRKLIKLDENN